ncbi:hypothetical protein [Paenibacillus thermotolerans]|uniref:hypothetical protein n=1 Tax=Paenibacillus thermotolerans TaxID=3027807 RepID=UPI0023676C82|nr:MULTISPECIES: hypothetical protein [unclassified Paenibacillus]
MKKSIVVMLSLVLFTLGTGLVSAAPPAPAANSDTTRDNPMLASVFALSNTTVEFVFTKPISKESAEDVNNYTIREKYGLTRPFLTIVSAKLVKPNTVLLTTSSQNSQTLYEANAYVIGKNGERIIGGNSPFVGK